MRSYTRPLLMYQLLPHNQKNYGLTIEASFSLTPHHLTLSFSLKNINNHYLFERQGDAKRVDELWKATCFEIFIKNPNGKAYWELNIAPNGSWNFYRFSDYKKDMQEELRVLPPKVLFIREGDEVALSFKLDFTEVLFEKNINFNLALILLDVEGERHFFTLNPKEGLADFHDFVLG